MPPTRIYLDHAATTAMLPEAQDAVCEAMQRWHNPSSPHAEGRAARAALEEARRRIGAALDWDGTILFTSGATEAIAIALSRAPCSGQFVSPLEHEAVYRAAPAASRLGLGPAGHVRLDHVAGERPLVAIQHVNNETGIVQPLDALAGQIRALGGLLLADCAQSAGKLPLPDADFIAISAHKFGGPPGIGALLVRDLATLQAIGGQEQGYRPGTQNLPAIAGMAAALEAGKGWMAEAAVLRERLDRAILEGGGEIVAADAERIATITSYRMPGVPSEVQLIGLDAAGFAVSAGSACSSGSLKASPVLEALGWTAPAAREVVRASFGRTTSQSEVDGFARAWRELAERRASARGRAA